MLLKTIVCLCDDRIKVDSKGLLETMAHLSAYHEDFMSLWTTPPFMWMRLDGGRLAVLVAYLEAHLEASGSVAALEAIQKYLLRTDDLNAVVEFVPTFKNVCYPAAILLTCHRPWPVYYTPAVPSSDAL